MAYILGKIIAELAVKLLAGMGFDSLPERLGLAKPAAEGAETPARTPSQMVGYIIIVAIMLFALIEASPSMPCYPAA